MTDRDTFISDKMAEIIDAEMEVLALYKRNLGLTIHAVKILVERFKLPCPIQGHDWKTALESLEDIVPPDDAAARAFYDEFAFEKAHEEWTYEREGDVDIRREMRDEARKFFRENF